MKQRWLLFSSCTLWSLTKHTPNSMNIYLNLNNIFTNGIKKIKIKLFNKNKIKPLNMVEFCLLLYFRNLADKYMYTRP